MSNLNNYVCRFAISLFMFFIKQPDNSNQKNIVFSPYSIHNLLSMVLNGATGNTSENMKSVLINNESLNIRSLNNEHFNLLKNINELKNDSGVILKINNFVFHTQDIKLNKKFKENIAEYYDSKIKTFDVLKKVKSIKMINRIVLKSTNGLIPEMISELSQNTKLILINTIYFKGKWLTQFDANQTEKKDFYCKNEAIKVDMMHKKDDFLHIENTSFTAIKMPYNDLNFSLMIFVPKENVHIKEIYKLVAKENFYSDVFNSMSFKKVSLSLPKFRISSKIDLKDAFIYLGLKRLVFAGTSELQHIIADSTINDVKFEQRTIIEVNEAGSEAAAATAMIMGRCALLEKDFVEMNVNRPFCFSLLYQNDSGMPLPLFMGTVENPLHYQ